MSSGCGSWRQPPHMEGIFNYFGQAVTASHQGLVLQLWIRGGQLLTIKTIMLQNVIEVLKLRQILLNDLRNRNLTWHLVHGMSGIYVVQAHSRQ